MLGLLPGLECQRLRCPGITKRFADVAPLSASRGRLLGWGEAQGPEVGFAVSSAARVVQKTTPRVERMCVICWRCSCKGKYGIGRPKDPQLLAGIVYPAVFGNSRLRRESLAHSGRSSTKQHQLQAAAASPARHAAGESHCSGRQPACTRDDRSPVFCRSRLHGILFNSCNLDLHLRLP